MRFLFWEVFDCVGRDFSDSWNDLYITLSVNSSPRETLDVAQKFVTRWRNHSESFWQVWPKVLGGENSQRDLRGFCAYGYCSALHRLLHSSQDKQLTDEFRMCAAWATPEQTALKPADSWWPWNFLIETRWSRFLSTSDLLHIHSGQGESWLASLAQSGVRQSLPEGDVSIEGALGLWARRGKMMIDGDCGGKLGTTSADLYLSSYRDQLRGALAVLPASKGDPLTGAGLPRKLGESAKDRSTVLIAAFGVHFTTLLEPISAIRQILPRSLRMAAVFYGSSHPPPEPIIQEVCPFSDDSTSDLMCFLSTSPGNAFWQKIVDRTSMAEAATHMSGVLVTDPYINRADFIVCGGGQSPTLCFIMRMVTGLPMLFTLQAPLSFRMPSNVDQRALLVAMFREMAPTTLASTSSAFLSRQVWVQTGCLIPVVRNHNWYAAHVPGRWGDGLRNEGESTPKEILFWQNHVALKTDCSMVVWRFMKQVVQDDFPYNIVFKNVRNLPGPQPGRKVYALRNQDSSILSFGDMRARFLGAVLFPHDLGMFSFDDLYALGVPLFLPTDEMIMQIAFAQLASTNNYPWYLLREEHAKLSFKRGDADAAPPWDPGWQFTEAMAPEARATWLGHDALGVNSLLGSMMVSNFKLYPHIRRFHSLTSLLQMLGCLTKGDLLATGEAMRESAKETWEVTAEYYRRVVVNLLGVELP